MYEQRDIILIPFPYSDLTGSKKRPALIISNKKLNKTEDRICILITSNNPKEGISIPKKYIESGSLPFKSWVKAQRIFTVDKRIIQRKLATVSKEFHNKVLASVQKYLS